MGTLIGLPAYLIELMQKGEREAAIVRRVASAVTRTAWQTGHVIDLHTSQARDGLQAASLWGNVAQLPLRCCLCNTIATLAEWELACNESREHRREVLIQGWSHIPKWKVAHLKRCDETPKPGLRQQSAESNGG